MFQKMSFKFANVKWDVPGCFWDGEERPVGRSEMGVAVVSKVPCVKNVLMPLPLCTPLCHTLCLTGTAHSTGKSCATPLAIKGVKPKVHVVKVRCDSLAAMAASQCGTGIT